MSARTTANRKAKLNESGLSFGSVVVVALLVIFATLAV